MTQGIPATDCPLTQDQLKEHLNYDPVTGLFTRKIASSNNVKIGEVAGYKSDGYIKIQVLGIRRMAHCFAWLYMTGNWPTTEIDHENGKTDDNRWKNLRPATHSFNQQNLKHAKKTSTTGLLGVNRMGRRYQAAIRIDGKKRFFGTFDTPEEAHQAYLKAKRKFHKGCTI